MPANYPGSHGLKAEELLPEVEVLKSGLLTGCGKADLELFI